MARRAFQLVSCEIRGSGPGRGDLRCDPPGGARQGAKDHDGFINRFRSVVAKKLPLVLSNDTAVCRFGGFGCLPRRVAA